MTYIRKKTERNKQKTSKMNIITYIRKKLQYMLFQ